MNEEGEQRVIFAAPLFYQSGWESDRERSKEPKLIEPAVML